MSEKQCELLPSNLTVQHSGSLVTLKTERTSKLSSPLSAFHLDCTSCLSTSTAPLLAPSLSTVGLLIPLTLSAKGEPPTTRRATAEYGALVYITQVTRGVQRLSVVMQMTRYCIDSTVDLLTRPAPRTDELALLLVLLCGPPASGPSRMLTSSEVVPLPAPLPILLPPLPLLSPGAMLRLMAVATFRKLCLTF